MSNTRNERQNIVANWCASAFGLGHAKSMPQRGVRLLEEAIETYQSCGCTSEMAHRLVDFVFSKEIGKLNQEIGGVGITLLALADAADMSAEHEEIKEFRRIMSKPLAHFSARNESKNLAGFNIL